MIFDSKSPQRQKSASKGSGNTPKFIKKKAPMDYNDDIIVQEVPIKDAPPTNTSNTNNMASLLYTKIIEARMQKQK